MSDNDIYWIESVEQPRAVRITSTGEDKIMFNGIPDWVYEGKFVMFTKHGSFGVQPIATVA